MAGRSRGRLVGRFPMIWRLGSWWGWRIRIGSRERGGSTRRRTRCPAVPGRRWIPQSPLRTTPWLAIAVADRTPGRADARIRSAAPIDEATARQVAGELVSSTDQIRWDDGRIVTRRVEALGAIVLNDVPLAKPDPLLVQAAVRDGLRRDGLAVLRWSEAALALRTRLAFCHAHLGAPWPAVDDAALLASLDDWLGPELASVRGARDLARIDVASALRRLLPWPAATRFAELAPESAGGTVRLPGATRVRRGRAGRCWR